jgi:hypothetical protein
VAATASIIIEVDATAPTAAIRQLNAEVAKLPPTLQATEAASTRTFSQITQDTQRARESTMLLRDEFGIGIPRALRSTIAEASLIGPIMTAAFSGLAALAFINIAEQVGNKISDVIIKMLGWAEATKKMMDLTAAANKNHLDTAVALDKLKKAYDLIGLTGIPLFSKGLQQAQQDLAAGNKAVETQTALLAKLEKQATETSTTLKTVAYGPHALSTATVSVTEPTAAAKAARAAIEEVRNQLGFATDAVVIFKQNVADAGKKLETGVGTKQAEEIKKIAAATQEASKRLEEMTAAAEKGGLKGDELIAADTTATLTMVEELWAEHPKVAAKATAAETEIIAESLRKRLALLEDETNKASEVVLRGMEADDAARQKFAEKQRRMEDQTLNIEKAAAVAMAPPWERANAAILASYEERMAKIRELLKTGDLDEQHAAREAAAAWNVAFSQMRDSMANQMETLYQDITSGNIGKAFLDMFRKMVFQMIATWVLGLQGMRAASGQASGGILGAIFGGGGGGGGGGQAGISGLPGVITNLFGGGGGAGIPSADAGVLQGLGMMSGMPSFSGDASSAVSIAGLGMSAGLGGGGLGANLPAGAGPGGAAAGIMGTGFAGMLSKLFSHGAGPISGAMLATLGLGIGIDGLMRGSPLGILESAGGGALVGFSIGGPIGALVGGIIGAIGGIVSWLFGSSKKDKQKTQLSAQLATDIKTVVNSYDLFQTDYNGAISALESLRAQYTTSFQKLGATISYRVTPPINAAEDQIGATQAERNRRGALAFGPAQFRAGGFVGPGAGGPVPSWFAGAAMQFAGGGAVPAFLHEGEYVMRSEAVSLLGRGMLDRMNSGGSVGTHVHFHIDAVDAKSVRELLSDSSVQKEFHRMYVRGVNEGRW